MYFKIKVLELLLYLDALELTQDSEEKPYFYKSQVEKVRAIRRFMEEHMEETYTQEELSKRFGISLTMMKKCFFIMYGTTMGAWLTSYRMNQAAVLLKSGQSLNVAEIAGRVGYDSPSKFAAAFRKVMKKSPTEYRIAGYARADYNKNSCPVGTDQTYRSGFQGQMIVQYGAGII